MRKRQRDEGKAPPRESEQWIGHLGISEVSGSVWLATVIEGIKLELTTSSEPVSANILLGRMASDDKVHIVGCAATKKGSACFGGDQCVRDLFSII